MECEYCNVEHDGLYASGRFCSQKCARGFSSRDKRKEINAKVSEKLKGKHSIRKEHIWTKEERSRHSEIIKAVCQKRNDKKSFEDLNKSGQKFRLFKLQNEKCAKCKNDFVWLGKPLMQELHHKDGNDKNKTLGNSELLCPNCHSITDNYMFKNRKHNKEALNKMSKASLSHWKKKKQIDSIGS